MKKTRDKSLDMVSGILILWIIAYHICQSVYLARVSWLYFMIPWFYFKSGMFFKPELNNSIIQYIKKRLNLLILSLLFWFTIGYLILCPELIMIDHKPLWKIVVSPFYRLFRYGELLGNAPLWFLLSLIFVQVLSFYVVRIKYYFVFILLLLLAGFFLQMNSVILPLGASTWPLGLFFYFSGYIYTKYFDCYDLKLFIIVSIPIFILGNIFLFSYVDVHYNKIEYGYYFSFVFLSLLGILFLLYFAKFIQINFLVWAGVKSLHFFVLHWPIYYILKISYTSYVGELIGSKFAFPLLLIATYLVCFITIKILDKLHNHWKIFKYI